MRRLLFLALALHQSAATAHVVADNALTDPQAGWNWDPWVTAPLALSALFYVWGIARLWRHAGRGRGLLFTEAGAFAAGWLALALALLSPLDALGGRSFAAHMLQHEILMLVSAPLLVLGRPLAAWAWALPRSARRGVGRLFRARAFTAAWRPLSSASGAWIAHALALWAWHAPALFNASVLNESLHTLQHLSFVLTALLFWWAVLRPAARFAPGGAILSLLTTMVHTGVLGALLTFSGTVWYPVYAQRLHDMGLDPLADQQLGGLIMWVPAGAVYMAFALALAMRWLRVAVSERRKEASPSYS